MTTTYLLKQLSILLDRILHPPSSLSSYCRSEPLYVNVPGLRHEPEDVDDMDRVQFVSADARALAYYRKERQRVERMNRSLTELERLEKHEQQQ